MSDEIKNLFISHIHEDDERLPALKKLLGDNGYDVRDSSINSSKPNNAQSEDYIKQKILAPQIDWAGALVVLVSPGTHESEWVDWEIEYAHRQGKHVIGVWDRGARDADLPANLETYGYDLVGWQAEGIIEALNGKTHWENPDGTPRPQAAIPHYSC